MTMKSASNCHAAEVLRRYPDVKRRLKEREDFWRSQAGNSGDSLGVQVDKKDTEQERIIGWMDGDPEVKRDREFVERVEAALDFLEKDELDMMTLSHVDGVSPEDVANLMHIALATYWKKQRKSLESIAQELFGVFS